MVQEITGGKNRRIVATYYNGELYHSRDVIPIKLNKDLPHPYYLLGILNSLLITWYHHKRNPKAKKGLFPKVLVSDLKDIPIRIINFDDQAIVNMHNNIVSLVERMLSLHEKLSRVTIPSDKNLYQRQISDTDKKIDAMVFKLYELNDEEIKTIKDLFTM